MISYVKRPKVIQFSFYSYNTKSQPMSSQGTSNIQSNDCSHKYIYLLT